MTLEDAIQCIKIVLQNKPKGYRSINQFEEVYSIEDLAEKVCFIGKEFGLKTDIQNLDNIRKEKTEHSYDVEHTWLLSKGYNPTWNMDDELRFLFKELLALKDLVIKDRIIPKITW